MRVIIVFYFKEKYEIVSAELDQLKEKQKNDRRNQRYSSHDSNRESLQSHVSIQTDKTDVNCMCDINSKKILELKNEIFMQQCDITKLKMEAENDYSAEEIKRVREDLDDAIRDKFEIKKEVVMLKSSLQKANKLRDEFAKQNDDLEKLNQTLRLQIVNLEKEYIHREQFENCEVCWLSHFKWLFQK